MDAVNAFNMELFSMIDMKPPISRAKMMSVTKSAIKAIKLYKHVVQIVEKFIKKCKPDLKVPGLYVVDSVVRQSRHQFGIDKDVFGPRFLKNFIDTFQNLYLCPTEDKSKIVRVLNLWQKNGVFEMDIIQPLLDMATGSFVPAPSQAAAAVSTTAQIESQPPTTAASTVASVSQLPNADALAAVAQLFQSTQGQELHKMLQNLQQDRAMAPTFVNNISAHDQMPAAQPISTHTEQKSSLAKTLLDRFDYDDEPEDAKNKDISGRPQAVPGTVFNQFPGRMPNMENYHPHMGETASNEYSGHMMHDVPQMMPDGYSSMNESYSRSREGSREESARREGRHRGYGRRSRSGSRSPRRRRSRSTSRSRRSRHRRSRSRSREHRRRSPRSRSQEKKEKERRQKGLPSIKNQTLSVCSTTLWVGQLDKKTQQHDVMSLLEEFGQVDSINMIPPRGCAYIVMVHRQDAFTALHKLSSGPYKVHQKPIKIAWALNKGIKSTHKKFWDVERGVTYVPWSKVKVEELESFREGGVLDTETFNPEWNNVLKDINKPAVNGALEGERADGGAAAQIQVPVAPQAAPTAGVPVFPRPQVMSPTSIPPGGTPFIPAGFDPTKLVPGFSPAAAEPVKTKEDSSKDSTANSGASSDAGTDSQLGSPGTPVMSPAGPVGLPGPRPGMPPMHHPPGMTGPHLPPFFPPPNMPPMPPQMMPGGPMFPPDRFRMMMPFPPRGPPFPPRHLMGPEGMDGRDGRHFRNGRPGFGGPPYQRGRW